MNARCCFFGLIATVCGPAVAASADHAAPRVVEVEFASHDGHAMFGKLALPPGDAPRAVVVYVQNAEGMTVDMKRPRASGGSLNYFDLYRRELTGRGLAFFSYEGRGVRMGDGPPRFEAIDRDAFNTGTLDNKTRDVAAAVEALRQRPDLRETRVLLIGSSEGTLIAAAAAARRPDLVDGLALYSLLSMNLRENFKYILTDGAFVKHRRMFDDDGDGRVSEAEFDADTKGFRARYLKGVPFAALDANKDGAFAADDMPLLSKPLVDAVDQDNFAILQAWAKANASVAVPDDWFKDHFAYPPIATFLSETAKPVGCFHGTGDGNAPVSGVRAIEARVKDAGKSNFEFHYFDGADHSLGVAAYFDDGELPPPHRAIIEFLDRTAGE